MDPATAWAEALKAIAEMVTEIVKGQPAEVKAKIWEQWIVDTGAVRKFFKLDG